MDSQILARTILVVFVYMTTWFAVALAIRRNDIADVAWGLGFIVVTVWLLLRHGAPHSTRQFVVSSLVTVWGLRLAYHIGKRNLAPGHQEDRRYAQWRREWGRWLIPRTYLQVFLLQGFFMVLISTPLLVVGSSAGPAIGALDVVGVAVWVFGFVFESIGDAQLADFRRKPENKGHVMDRGLWAWTRHPNYFGEATMWWGLGLVAMSVPGGWIGLLGPITITWLLTKVSGIPLAEANLAGRPEWEAYKIKTSAFVPLPRRRG